MKISVLTILLANNFRIILIKKWFFFDFNHKMLWLLYVLEAGEGNFQPLPEC